MILHILFQRLNSANLIVKKGKNTFCTGWSFSLRQGVHGCGASGKEVFHYYEFYKNVQGA